MSVLNWPQTQPHAARLAFVDATACAGPSVVEWNATAGVNGTVVFKVAGNAPPEAMGWCADYYRPSKQVRSGVACAWLPCLVVLFMPTHLGLCAARTFSMLEI